MPAQPDAVQTVERDALYYPYIHIRNADWLRRALLVFPHVARIVPRDFLPRDTTEIWEFENTLGRWDKPLLRDANLDTHGVRQAQLQLLSMLSDDLERIPDFRNIYGRPHRGRVKSDRDGFRLHHNKPLYELVHFLMDNQLMWYAENASHSGDTVVHPLIGEAIMSTLAMACAQDEGFDVVTDDGRVHHNISDSDVADLYWKFLHRDSAEESKYKATGKNICELIIFQQCNVDKLTPAGLAELSKDHEAIDAFRSTLSRIAERIPEMQDSKAFEARLKAAVDDALRAWQRDKMNLSKVSKEILGRDMLKPTEGFLKSLVEKFAPPIIGAAGGAASAGFNGILVGAAGGFVIALLLHGLTSWSKVRERAQNSPYRYLTQIEKAGVAFTVAA